MAKTESDMRTKTSRSYRLRATSGPDDAAAAVDPGEVRHVLLLLLATAGRWERARAEGVHGVVHEADGDLLLRVLEAAQGRHDDQPIGRVNRHVVRRGDVQLYACMQNLAQVIASFVGKDATRDPGDDAVALVRDL